MYYLNKKTVKNNKGFTVLEVLISVSLLSIIGLTAYSFTTESITNFLHLEEDGLRLSTITDESQRIAKVVRGATDVSTATYTNLSIDGYFSPGDAYVSKIDYYKSADGKNLLADVTPYTVNPPIGSLITASKKTYTIIDNFYTPASVNTFTYLDSAGGILSMPITELRTIYGIRVSLSVKTTTNSTSFSTISLDVSLRNRKTNL